MGSANSIILLILLLVPNICCLLCSKPCSYNAFIRCLGPCSGRKRSFGDFTGHSRYLTTDEDSHFPVPWSDKRVVRELLGNLNGLGKRTFGGGNLNGLAKRKFGGQPRDTAALLSMMSVKKRYRLGNLRGGYPTEDQGVRENIEGTKRRLSRPKHLSRTGGERVRWYNSLFRVVGKRAAKRFQWNRNSDRPALSLGRMFGKRGCTSGRCGQKRFVIASMEPDSDNPAKMNHFGRIFSLGRKRMSFNDNGFGDQGDDSANGAEYFKDKRFYPVLDGEISGKSYYPTGTADESDSYENTKRSVDDAAGGLSGSADTDDFLNLGRLFHSKRMGRLGYGSRYPRNWDSVLGGGIKRSLFNAGQWLEDGYGQPYPVNFSPSDSFWRKRRAGGEKLASLRWFRLRRKRSLRDRSEQNPVDKHYYTPQLHSGFNKKASENAKNPDGGEYDMSAEKMISFGRRTYGIDQNVDERQQLSTPHKFQGMSIDSPGSTENHGRSPTENFKSIPWKAQQLLRELGKRLPQRANVEIRSAKRFYRPRLTSKKTHRIKTAARPSFGSNKGLLGHTAVPFLRPMYFNRFS